MEASWTTLAGLAEVAYPKAGKTDPGFRNEGRNGILTIVKVNKAGKKLTCKFNT